MIAPRLLATACCALALAACEPPPDDAPPADAGGPDPGEGDAGGGEPGSGEPGGGDAPGDAAPTAPSLTLSFAPGDAPEGASAVEVELVAIALFDRPASWRDADTPCDGGGAGALAPHAARVEVGFGAAGGPRVPIARLERTGGGELTEVWLVVRAGTLRTAAGGRPVHAERLCLMPDGLQYTVLRARPRGGVTLDADREIALELGRGQLRAERVDCRDAPDLAECATPDDGGDDDPDTRLYYRFAGELPARVVE